jgi:hypothetical protein
MIFILLEDGKKCEFLFKFKYETTNFFFIKTQSSFVIFLLNLISTLLMKKFLMKILKKICIRMKILNVTIIFKI